MLHIKYILRRLHIVAFMTSTMNKFMVISIVCLFLIAKISSETTGWSSWANCAESDGCFQKRTFRCDAGEGIECLNEADGAFEQRALNCNATPECLENITETFHSSEVSFAALVLFYLNY